MPKGVSMAFSGDTERSSADAAGLEASLLHLVHDHHHASVKLREASDNAKKDAIRNASRVSQLLVDAVNCGVQESFVNENRIELEIRALGATITRFMKQTDQWLASTRSINTAVKGRSLDKILNLGVAPNFALSLAISPMTIVNNVKVILPVVEACENKPITWAEFNQFVAQNDRRFQEILDAIQRLSTNRALGVLLTERIPVARDPEDSMGRGEIPRLSRQYYVEEMRNEDFQEMQIRGGHRYTKFLALVERINHSTHGSIFADR